jgi:molybdate transport system permease protein
MQYPDAHRLSAVMLVFSFLVLLAIYAWRPKPNKGA